MKKMIKLILVIVCMITIFCFSSDEASSSTKKSDGVIKSITKLITGDKVSSKKQQDIIDKYVVIVRKSAHFIIYFILGTLIISYLREYNFTYKKLMLLAIFLAFLYACSDEVHQLFVNGRSGQFSDVLLDTIGSGCGVFIYSLIYKVRRKKYE